MIYHIKFTTIGIKFSQKNPIFGARVSFPIRFTSALIGAPHFKLLLLFVNSIGAQSKHERAVGNIKRI